MPVSIREVNLPCKINAQRVEKYYYCSTYLAVRYLVNTRHKWDGHCLTGIRPVRFVSNEIRSNGNKNDIKNSTSPVLIILLTALRATESVYYRVCYPGDRCNKTIENTPVN